METKTKNRGWVKNVAIIFLAVMLVLTFFSNTFMNRSLPEVATQMVTSNSITEKIRGTGTVKANQNYEVKVSQTRTVKSVLVKADQEVNEGDVLFILSAGDSEELEAAQESLRQLNLSYQKALVNAAESDYAKENRDIQTAKQSLQDAEAKRDSLTSVSNADIAAAKDAVADAKLNVSELQKKLDKAKADEPADAGDSSAAEAALKKAEEALDKAERALEEALATDDFELLYDFMVAVAKDEIEYVDHKEINDSRIAMYLPYIVELITGNPTSTKPDVPDGDGATQQDETDVAKKTASLKPDGGSVSERLEGHTSNNTSRFFSMNPRFAPDDYYPGEYSNAYEIIVAAQNEVTKCRAAVDEAEIDVENSSSGKVYSEKVKKLERQLAEAKTAQTDAEAALTDLQTKQGEYDAALESVKSCQKNLEDLIFSLQEQQKADNKNERLQAIDLSDMAYQISKQQEKVNDLSGESTSNEITAPVSGVVRSVNITAGNTTSADTALATIEIPDMGYSLSFSVTNEQSRKVRVGDTASISNYYYGNTIEATLSSIKTDPQNAQTNKLLVFDLTGDVTPGSSLTVSIGQRSQEYEYVVPKSAIRSDSNGDFVLIVTAKSSPLGNRYKATRVDVQQLASDDTSVAVSGGITNGDYVITTSTAPIKNGDRVRMADSLS
jgi:multidrug efflux pump subunit AcrA (membrane-fusion protein)